MSVWAGYAACTCSLQMLKARAGFTLLELMIVITIMGGMAALIAPGISEYMADIRASGASEDLIRLSRHVRSRAQETGLAHLIVFSGSSNDSGGLGRLLVYEGMNNHCRQTPWPQAVNGTVANGQAPVDSVDLSRGNYNPISGGAPRIDDSSRQVISVSVAGSSGAPSSAIICYEPSGATLEGIGDSSNIGFAFNSQTQDITFSVLRAVDGTQRGAVRYVVFPPGGSASPRH
jgi:prepilin-type N-terminal cleavage/methylation domain-containing protein